MEHEKIILIRMQKRRDGADTLQRVLTEFGCIIKTRLGLHAAGDFCSEAGLIILQLVNEPQKVAELEKSLAGLDGISFKSVGI